MIHSSLPICAHNQLGAQHVVDGQNSSLHEGDGEHLSDGEHAAPDTAAAAVPNLEQLTAVTDEEERLHVELRQLADRQIEIMGRLEFLRELRRQMQR